MFELRQPGRNPSAHLLNRFRAINARSNVEDSILCLSQEQT
jgi:hypothetical protein